MKNEIKPCPCCGCKTINIHMDYPTCSDCGLSAPSIKIWNIRTESQVVALTDAIKSSWAKALEKETEWTFEEDHEWPKWFKQFYFDFYAEMVKADRQSQVVADLENRIVSYKTQADRDSLEICQLKKGVAELVETLEICKEYLADCDLKDVTPYEKIEQALQRAKGGV